MAYRIQKEKQLAQAAEQALQQSVDAELFQFADYDPDRAEQTGYSNYSYWKSTFAVFRRNKVAMGLLILIAVILLFTFIQPYLPGQRPATLINNDPVTGMHMANRKPDAEFWFGTNSIGQDLWSMVWSGTRTSLFIGFSVACVEAVVGICVGILWGYLRKLDVVFTEVYNIIDNIPQTIVLILLSYIMRPGIGTLIFAMCMTGWAQMARFIRNQVIIIRDRDYNLASRCLGTPLHRIMLRNLLPYLVSIIMLRMALAIPAAIGNEVFITYIGLGLPVDTPSLGNLINTGRTVMTTHGMEYQLLFPTAVLSVITISFYIIGNAFADAADPKNHVF
ncbi:MAG TPA: ABC transporter permease [Candidatus Anaerofilum faecale]|nr:ABC transporter permease [Anaerofilum sp. An201]OUP01866.1 ABC transporter permease [Anaerofilum sp. An201]HIX13174.1 ABC transporter permease [Candidatus Anaerofilum faecale]